MPNDTSMPDVEAARMKMHKWIECDCRDPEGCPARDDLAALEAAVTARAQQPLKELLERVLPLLEDGVEPGDGFRGNAEFLGNIWVTAATNRIADIRAVLKP